MSESDEAIRGEESAAEPVCPECGLPLSDHWK